MKEAIKKNKKDLASTNIFLALFACLLFAGCKKDNNGGGMSSGSNLAIEPMTIVNVSAGTGYFQDPYPIHTLMASSSSGLPTFSGTNPLLLSCPTQIQPGGFISTPVTIETGEFKKRVDSVGSHINNFENLNIYQDNTGAWHMALTAHITAPGKRPWNIIVHASPESSGAGVPTSWMPDSVLVGKINVSATENYDGKYFEDNGTLYLLYSATLLKGVSTGIVAQPMISAQIVNHNVLPIPLLGPETLNGGYNSEIFNPSSTTDAGLKLIETGNVIKIQGKYVMTYSDGGYNQTNYKSGIAWSDTFLPTSGSYYTRVQKIDVAGVWGQSNHAEVQYLLQAQIPQWPNYAGKQVLAPGVPAIVNDASGNYYLTFAGYDPSDSGPDTSVNYTGTKRRPYYVKLQVQIPSNATVGSTSPLSLTNWIQPVTKH